MNALPACIAGPPVAWPAAVLIAHATLFAIAAVVGTALYMAAVALTSVTAANRVCVAAGSVASGHMIALADTARPTRVAFLVGATTISITGWISVGANALPVATLLVSSACSTGVGAIAAVG